MQLIDWILVILPIALVLGFAVYTQRFVKSVADFLAGGRCAGRYLIANAKGEAASGVANTMSKFEQIMVAGFTLAFWEKITVPIMLLIGISGFVIYRYRETRALTLGQFFEMRYSRPFRLFMGGLAFFSGVLNYGIFPAVSSRFFVYFIGLPTTVHLGPITMQTYVLVMALYMTCSVMILMFGGQVTLMVTDCLEGLMSHLVYMIIIVAIFMTIGWSEIVQTMSATPPQQSMINPFDSLDVGEFNVTFVAMGVFLSIYGTMALQNAHGFNSAARTPHESRMAGVLGNWRNYARTLMLLVMTTAAVTYLRHKDFNQQSKPIHEHIAAVDPAGGDSKLEVGSQAWVKDKATPQLEKQMTIPIALSYLLPVGIKGLFCSIMVLGLMAGDCGHMHSWSSIFIQDVILPLRTTPLTPKQHLAVLRLSVVFVACAAFIISILLTQVHFITMWMNVTAAVFTAGAGAAIIGGLYWKKGTVGGAWAAVIIGTSLSLGGIIVSQFWTEIVSLFGGIFFGKALPKKFWFNGQEIAFYSALAAINSYVLISFVSRRPRFNLDKMLHRGIYALPGTEKTKRHDARSRFHPARILGFDSNFTRMDKFVAGGIFAWSLLLVAVNLFVSFWNAAISKWPVNWWANYWLITGIGVPFAIAAITLVWFGIGGIIDMRDFFRALHNLKRDARDDGRVVGTHNLADEPTRGFPVVAPEAVAVAKAEAQSSAAAADKTPAGVS